MAGFDLFAKFDDVLKKIEDTDPVKAVESALQKFEDTVDAASQKLEGGEKPNDKT